MHSGGHERYHRVSTANTGGVRIHALTESVPAVGCQSVGACALFDTVDGIEERAALHRCSIEEDILGFVCLGGLSG